MKKLVFITLLKLSAVPVNAQHDGGIVLGSPSLFNSYEVGLYALHGDIWDDDAWLMYTDLCFERHGKRGFNAYKLKFSLHKEFVTAIMDDNGLEFFSPGLNIGIYDSGEVRGLFLRPSLGITITGIFEFGIHVDVLAPKGIDNNVFGFYLTLRPTAVGVYF